MPQEDSPLESLRERVYRQQQSGDVSVPQYSHTQQPQPYGWQAPPAPAPKKRVPWTVLFLAGAGAFLTLAGAAAAFLVLHGTRAVSTERVQFTVDSPISIASGDTVPLIITIRNENPAVLNNATLFVALPQGTRSGTGEDAPFTQYSDALGSIPAGGQVTRTVQVKLFGTEGQQLSIPMKVEYRTEGSNALYVSESTHGITVSTSPISVQVQTLSQTPSGQPLTLNIVVRSNASSAVNNVALLAQYPSGFSVRRTDPAQTGTNLFAIGTLAPGEQKTVRVEGTLTGQSADQRVFRFTAGTPNPNGTNTLSNSFAEGSASVSITNPFLNVGLSLNRESADTIIAKPGSIIGATLSWQNTLPSALANAGIQVRLSGNALDTGNIKGGTGFYRSQDSSIVFDSSNTASLGLLSSGDIGAGAFSFGILPESALMNVSNPTVMLSVSITGQQGNSGSSADVLRSTLTRTVKVGTSVRAASVISRTGFTQSGPVPPAPGTETTYTVTLSAQNSLNSVGAGKETFTLPSYVRFLPSADKGIVYNPDTRTVTWTIGDIPRGGSVSAKFQVGFTPSASQSGSQPVLVNEQSLSGIDRFTGIQVSAAAPALTTELQGNSTSGTVR